MTASAQSTPGPTDGGRGRKEGEESSHQTFVSVVSGANQTRDAHLSTAAKKGPIYPVSKAEKVFFLRLCGKY